MKLPTPPQPQLREIRYVLADMLAEVAAERQTGSYGMERVRGADIRRLVQAKSRKRRGLSS